MRDEVCDFLASHRNDLLDCNGVVENPVEYTTPRRISDKMMDFISYAVSISHPFGDLYMEQSTFLDIFAMALFQTGTGRNQLESFDYARHTILGALVREKEDITDRIRDECVKAYLWLVRNNGWPADALVIWVVAHITNFTIIRYCRWSHGIYQRFIALGSCHYGKGFGPTKYGRFKCVVVFSCECTLRAKSRLWMTYSQVFYEGGMFFDDLSIKQNNLEIDSVIFKADQVYNLTEL